jgi:hypothetical protein
MRLKRMPQDSSKNMGLWRNSSVPGFYPVR